MLDGVNIKIGTRDFVVPPLNFARLKQQEDNLARVKQGGNMDAAWRTAVVEVVHAAVTRNYPDVTRETIEENLDLGNMKRVIEAICGNSGLTDAGEATAGS